MKQTLLLMTLILATACTANDTSDLTPSTLEGTLNAEASLGQGAEVVFREHGSEIRVKVGAIEDSRCPSDVQCIQGGHAKVSFHISATDQTVDLFIPLDAFRGYTDSYKFSASSNTYILTLKDVHPYPTTKNEKEIRTAEFILTEIPD